MATPRNSKGDRDPASADVLLVRVWCVGLLALLAATWRLWTPRREPPALPALSALTGLPPAIDYACLAACAAALVLALSRPTSRRAVAMATGCLAALMALDQLRWQPWAYQALLVGAALAWLPSIEARRWLRVLLASVYLYAAIAKLDVVFINTTGQQVVGALARLIGIDPAGYSPTVRQAWAAAMPTGEAAVGLLLAWPRLRRVGVAAAVLLHASIVLALGPLGLGHSSGVLLWNAASATLVAVLFWPAHQTEAAADVATVAPAGGVFARIALTAGVVLPLTSPLTASLDLCDRWPAWGLYAPRGERTEVYVHASVADRLPASLPLEPTKGGEAWRRARLDEWVLHKTGAPVYPQNRVAVALALALNERGRLGSYLRVDVDSIAHRLTGQRQRLRLEGAEAVEAYAARRYWLSTASRRAR